MTPEFRSAAALMAGEEEKKPVFTLATLLNFTLSPRWLLSHVAPSRNTHINTHTLLFPAMLVLASSSHYCLLSARTAVLLLLPALLSCSDLINSPRYNQGGVGQNNSSFWLIPPAAEGLESKFSSMSSPPSQQQRLGFPSSSSQSRDSPEITAQKLPLLLFFKVCLSDPGEVLSLTIGVDLTTAPGLRRVGEGYPAALQFFCMALNRTGLLS